MEITIAEQTKTFLLSIALGAALGVCYDVFRIVRIGLRHNAAAVAVEDLAFSMICAAATFFYLVSMNCGGIRLFVLVGEVVGFALYYCTIGSLVMGISRRIIEAIKWIGRMIYKILIAPIRRLLLKTGQIFSNTTQKAADQMKNNLKNSKTYLKKHHRLLYNLKQRHLKKRQVRNAKKQESKRK